MRDTTQNGFWRRFVRTAGWAACLCLSAGMASAATPPDERGIPFEEVQQHNMAITVPTDRGDLRLVVDTGSETVMLTRQAQQTLNLRVRPLGHVGHVSVYQGKLSEMRLGKIVLHNVPCAVKDTQGKGNLEIWNKQHPEARIDGLLGMPVLKNLAIGIDMPEHRVRFWNHGKIASQEVTRFLTEDLGGQTFSPVHRIPMAVTGTSMEVPVQVGDVRTRLLIDTGAPVNMIGRRLASYLHPLTSVLNGTKGGVEQQESATIFAVPDLTLDGEVFCYPWFLKAGVVDRMKACGFLGNGIFRSGRFLIDAPGQSFYFARPLPVEKTSLDKIGDLGILSLDTDDGVKGVLFAGIAQAVGVQSQEFVMEIDHRSLPQIQNMPWNASADKVTLTLKMYRSDGPRLRDLVVSLAALQSPSGNYTPPTEVFSLLPNEYVIYSLPYGGVYVPAGYKGQTDRTGKDAPVPTPAGGYLLPNKGPEHTDSAIRMKDTPLPNNGAKIYDRLEEPITIKPGYYWVEMPEVQFGNCFFVMAPATAPVD